jgi:hypothetical protein
MADKNTVTVKKTGDRGGVKPGDGGSNSLRNAPLAIQGGGSSPTGWVPKKTRVIGTGQV